MNDSGCHFIKHEDVGHIYLCKEHEAIHCMECKSAVKIQNTDYWKERGLSRYVQRHKDCDSNSMHENLGGVVEDILREQYLHIGMTMLGEIDNKKVLCLIHESEPSHGQDVDDDGGDSVACAVMSIDSAHEMLNLGHEHVLAMTDECPYVILAIDGMRYVRELSWSEIAGIWQRCIEGIAAELDKVKIHMN